MADNLKEKSWSEHSPEEAWSKTRDQYIKQAGVMEWRKNRDAIKKKFDETFGDEKPYSEIYEGMGMGEAALRNIAASPTFAHADDAYARTKALYDKITTGKDTTAKHSREQNLAEEAAFDKYPLTSLATGALGDVATGAAITYLTGGMGGVAGGATAAKGLTKAQKLYDYLSKVSKTKKRLASGGLAGHGTATAPVTEDPLSTGANVGFGAAITASMPKALQYAGKAVPTQKVTKWFDKELKPWLLDKGGDLALKSAIGWSKKGYKEVAKRSKDLRRVKDAYNKTKELLLTRKTPEGELLVQYGDQIEDVTLKSYQLLRATGEKIGEVRDAIDGLVPDGVIKVDDIINYVEKYKKKHLNVSGKKNQQLIDSIDADMTALKEKYQNYITFKQARAEKNKYTYKHGDPSEIHGDSEVTNKLSNAFKKALYDVTDDFSKGKEALGKYVNRMPQNIIDTVTDSKGKIVPKIKPEVADKIAEAQKLAKKYPEYAEDYHLLKPVVVAGVDRYQGDQAINKFGLGDMQVSQIAAQQGASIPSMIATTAGKKLIMGRGNATTARLIRNQLGPEAVPRLMPKIKAMKKAATAGGEINPVKFQVYHKMLLKSDSLYRQFIDGLPPATDERNETNELDETGE